GLDAALAGIADHFAAGAEHAVAGDDDRDRIGAAGGADGAGDGAEALGDIAVGQGLAEGDLAHHLPDLAMEFAAGRSEWEIEHGELAVEVILELPLGSQ